MYIYYVFSSTLLCSSLRNFISKNVWVSFFPIFSWLATKKKSSHHQALEQVTLSKIWKTETVNAKPRNLQNERKFDFVDFKIIFFPLNFNDAEGTNFVPTYNLLVSTKSLDRWAREETVDSPPTKHTRTMDVHIGKLPLLTQQSFFDKFNFIIFCWIIKFVFFRLSSRLLTNITEASFCCCCWLFGSV
jgi:hypothetical protein